MKLGLSYWMVEGGLSGEAEIADAMTQAKDAGFDAIELAVADTGVLTAKTSREECGKIVEIAEKTGIEISSLASGQSWSWSPTDNDPAVREKIIDFTAKSLQIAKWLGTDAYLFVPGAVDVFFLPEAEVVPYDVCYERATEAVRRLVPIAEQLGVALSLENVWNKFLLSPLEMRDFIDGFKSDMVGSYFDAGNVLQTGYPDQWIRILAGRIKRVHIKDFKKSVGTVDGFVDLLEGDVDLAGVKNCLDDIGYDGYVTAEVLPYEPGRVEKTAAAMKQFFK